jgi:hypothetical protein
MTRDMPDQSMAGALVIYGQKDSIRQMPYKTVRITLLARELLQGLHKAVNPCLNRFFRLKRLSAEGSIQGLPQLQTERGFTHL